jgi:hypothetical protein
MATTLRNDICDDVNNRKINQERHVIISFRIAHLLIFNNLKTEIHKVIELPAVLYQYKM